MDCVKFPSIEQFRHVIRNVQHKASFIGFDEAAGGAIHDNASRKPVLPFVGYVKLHGTNAGIVYQGGSVQFQSRERVLTVEADNAGFFAHMSARMGNVMALTNRITAAIGEPDTLAIYGEWCGQGIQKNVAISALTKMFVIFAVKANDTWLNVADLDLKDEAACIYNIANFPHFNLSIDFESPAEAQNELVRMTEQVEAECPVGKAFGQSGVGEGIVWRCTHPDYNSSNYWFKVKGEKHSESKVKTLAEVDVEAMRSINDFVSRAVTDARCEHALSYITDELQKPFEMTSMGDFIRRVFCDIAKEEADTIKTSGLTSKALGGPISNAAKRWYVAKLNESAMA